MELKSGKHEIQMTGNIAEEDERKVLVGCLCCKNLKVSKMRATSMRCLES